MRLDAEDVRELDVPVEEAVLAGEVGDQLLGRGQVEGAFVGAEVLNDRWVIAVVRVAIVLGWTKAAHQASARASGSRRSALVAKLLGLTLLMDVEVFQAVREGVGDRRWRAWRGRR